MINKIKFKNYKLFKGWQTLELKPITILIGKNNSGKSSILKLPTLIENSLSGKFQEPFLLKHEGIVHGEAFEDLVYGRNYAGILEIGLEDETEKFEIAIGSNPSDNNLEIFSWKLNNTEIDTSEETFTGFLATSKKIENLSLNTNYISSYRTGLERYFEKPKVNDIYDVVGIKGENVYRILIKDELTTTKKIITKVSDFYKKNFKGWSLKIEAGYGPPYQIELEKYPLKINLKEVGSGVIHALPLVVQSLIPANQETLIIVEEPELHLHPAAHGNLAQIFTESLQDKNKHYLIETHSQNFILRLRRLVAEGKLNKEWLAIYYVDFDEDKKESNLVRINVDELGKPRDEAGNIYWPKNIFSETLDETSAIRTAQLDKQRHDH
ncbi:MAG: AAA family ATPase [Thiomargarita sp.]|nr:AAA family ATPase [Bacteroidales bacterium]MCK5720135.1 AAA family ATPase [Thiomargarita sp.]